MVSHLIVECTKYSVTRTNLNIPTDIAEALSEGQTINLIDFLNKTNIINTLTDVKWSDLTFIKKKFILKHNLNNRLITQTVDS